MIQLSTLQAFHYERKSTKADFLPQRPGFCRELMANRLSTERVTNGGHLLQEVIMRQELEQKVRSGQEEGNRSPEKRNRLLEFWASHHQLGKGSVCKCVSLEQPCMPQLWLWPWRHKRTRTKNLGHKMSICKYCSENIFPETNGISNRLFPEAPLCMPIWLSSEE